MNNDPKRVVRGFVEPVGYLGPHNSSKVSLAGELPHGTAGQFLVVHPDGVGPVEKWMVEWAWSRNPYLIDREIVERIMGEIVPEKLLDTAAVYAALDHAVHAALAEILGG